MRGVTAGLTPGLGHPPGRCLPASYRQVRAGGSAGELSRSPRHRSKHHYRAVQTRTACSPSTLLGQSRAVSRSGQARPRTSRSPSMTHPRSVCRDSVTTLLPPMRCRSSLTSRRLTGLRNRTADRRLSSGGNRRGVQSLLGPLPGHGHRPQAAVGLGDRMYTSVGSLGRAPTLRPAPPVYSHAKRQLQLPGEGQAQRTVKPAPQARQDSRRRRFLRAG
jgi:hypothetical protein